MARKAESCMSIADVQRSALGEDVFDTPAGVNNFSIVAATVNSSGSQTANTSLMRALVKMGIPVSGKNLFPAHIQGLPTWLNVRLSEDSFTARRERAESLVE